MTIKDLKTGQSATVNAVGGEGALRQHFLDMGLIPGAGVKLVGKAPLGDPLQILIQGYTLTLRKNEADQIAVSPCEESNPETETEEHVNFGYNLTLHEHNSHPGYGEEGKYHHHEDEANAVPKSETLTFALSGQQNSGKTTLFNQLTGSSQHVGNFPGVTVDRKDGQIIGIPNTLVTDLPGIYSLSPYTTEEIVSRDFILHSHPNCLINIVDASNLERHLYLTVQLMELGVPMVLALNMMDEVAGNGGSIRVNEMEAMLGLPVLPISAAENKGIHELVQHAMHVARYREVPVHQDFCSAEDYGGAVHRCLHSIIHLIEDHARKTGIPARFAATKIAEGDPYMAEALGLDENEKETMEHIIVEMESERGLDRAAAIADMRYSFIKKLCDQTVIKPRESKEYIRSRKIDKVLTGKWTALPIFVLVMAMVIWLSIDIIGAPLQNLLAMGIDALSGIVDKAMLAASVTPAIRSLVVDAVFGGVGSVVSFVPIIVVLFFFLSILEDSGYMARVAFVTDKLLRKIGLSGRSIVPLLIGLGCSVPAVLATRTLPSARDRKMTVMLTPFMSCSAKIPVYAFLASAFFPGKGGIVLACLYLFAVVVGIIVALVSRHIGNRSQPAPFVMEMPNYRIPQAKNVGHLLWDKSKDFIRRAFTIIFLATIVIWVLQSFTWRFNFVEGGQGSMLAAIGGWIAPVFKPIGLGDWRIVTAFISGFLAKESVVATMELLGVTGLLTTITAVPMLIFSLLYTPCVATIAAVRKELGRIWAVTMVIFQCVVAWVAAFAVYQLLLLFL